MKTTTTGRGFIFDMDGLMVDTESLAVTAWQRALRTFNLSMSQTQLNGLVGLGEDACVRYTNEQLNVNLPAEQMKKTFMDHIWLQLKDGIEPMPGLLPLLSDLSKHGAKLAVASNSPRDYVWKMLEMIHAKPYLDQILTVEDIPNPKPAPDIYMLSVERLGISSAQCLVMEDSLPGVRAALAAGVPCAFIPNSHLSQEDIASLSPACRYTCSSLPELHLALEATWN